MKQPTLSDLQELVLQAGEILRQGYEQEHQVEHKGVIDLVTEVDRASEQFLLSSIRQRFPEHAILAEESGGTQDGEHQWYIDPLDGTVNYAHGVPIFCVSLAYAFRGEVAMAAIYDPMRQELFTAERGKGAWLNGHPIQVSPARELAESLLVTGFPYDAWHARRNNFDYFIKFARRTQGVRRLGSAALDLCYVAAGRFDGFWEFSLKPWDVAAGALIAAEAGAIVTNAEGGADYFSPPQSILAATPGIYPAMLEILRSDPSDLSSSYATSGTEY
uniref:Inositol-1-monophosphatase n=1 Tax=uncultured Chloroflexota bacterium TaxID=166587 RepID=H5SMV0_9CHLR|nr:myo-inositol-1(or 4)-monophosphatase [uncultured Chloroflexota bacterium]